MTLAASRTGHRAGRAQAGDVDPDLRSLAAEQAETGTLNWLATVGLLYQEQQLRNQRLAHRLTRLFATLAVVTTGQSLLWIVAIGVR